MKEHFSLPVNRAVMNQKLIASMRLADYFNKTPFRLECPQAGWSCTTTVEVCNIRIRARKEIADLLRRSGAKLGDTLEFIKLSNDCWHLHIHHQRRRKTKTTKTSNK